MNRKFDSIERRLQTIDSRLESIDQRLSRLEGAFLERGQWEGRLYSLQKNMTEEKK
jgi:prefoldin subunit 5